MPHALVPQSNARPVPHRTRRAFSLIECVTALAVTGIILASAASLVVILSRTLELTAAEVDGDRAAEAVDLLTADLAEALEFIAASPTAATFLVPDRDGNGQPEKIAYAWSGVPGDPLVRTLNDAQPRVVLRDVRGLAIDTIVLEP